MSDAEAAVSSTPGTATTASATTSAAPSPSLRPAPPTADISSLGREMRAEVPGSSDTIIPSTHRGNPQPVVTKPPFAPALRGMAENAHDHQDRVYLAGEVDYMYGAPSPQWHALMDPLAQRLRGPAATPLEKHGNGSIAAARYSEDEQLTMHQAHGKKWAEPWAVTPETFHGYQPDGARKEDIAWPDHEPTQRHRVLRPSWWRGVLLRNVFVPLAFRLLNVMLITGTLAVCITLRIALRRNGVEHAVGTSPLIGIIFSPPSIVHAWFQTWLEYFSPPIGVWRLGSKLWYTALELVFICLWSAELSLVMDNYFTSAIVCSGINSPFVNAYRPLQRPLKYPWQKSRICSLQVALICLCFVSLLVYICVFMVRGVAMESR